MHKRSKIEKSQISCHGEKEISSDFRAVRGVSLHLTLLPPGHFCFRNTSFDKSIKTKDAFKYYITFVEYQIDNSGNKRREEYTQMRI